LATQRITIAKIGGASADVVLQRVREWSSARQTDNSNLWEPAQWPEGVRTEADEFAEQLRAHALAPPVVHFVEWADLWSMGDLFLRWLTPPDGPVPFSVHANQHQIFAYGLPDGGRLARHLADAGPQQWTETDWFIARLREAIVAWEKLVDRAALIVLRRVFDGSVSDEQVTASLRTVPDWLR
jgi:hypothetical protein